MNTSEAKSAAPDALSDLQAVADHVATGMPLDPEVSRRVSDRAERARRELLAARGVQEIGVEIIREMRGELADT